MATTNAIGVQYSDWKPFSGRIHKAGEIAANQFATGATVGLFASNSPTFGDDTFDNSRIIGLIQDWNLQQVRQAPQLFECGSNGKYTLSTGRISGSLTVSRVIFHGANLLWLLYGGQVPEGSPYYEDRTDIAGYWNNKNNDPQGFAINLASSAFMNTLGIGFVIRTPVVQGTGDSASYNFGAFFLEHCNITSHAIGASAGAPYVGEQVSMTFESIAPIASNVGDTQWGAPLSEAA